VQDHRVESHPFGLGHFFAAGSADERMQADISERDFAGEMNTHHDHARDPEEENVVSGYEQRCWIILLKVFRFLGPTQGRERPKLRAEPCIQYIRILLELRGTAFRALLRRIAG